MWVAKRAAWREMKKAVSMAACWAPSRVASTGWYSVERKVRMKATIEVILMDVRWAADLVAMKAPSRAVERDLWRAAH